MPLNIRSINGVSIANDGTATIGGGATYAQAAAASAAEAALYDGKKVDTFAELDALTSAEIDVGDLVRVIETGAVYERVASGADFTTAGGIGVIAIGSFFTPEQFGAVGDGAVDDTSAFQLAVNAASARNVRRVVARAGGRYRLTDTLSMPSRMTLDITSATIEWAGGDVPIIASKGYLDDSGPLGNLHIVGGKSGRIITVAGHTGSTNCKGVVLRDFYSSVQGVTFANVPGGDISIVFTSLGDVDVPGTLVENKFIGVSFFESGGTQISAQAGGTPPKITDGFISDCVFWNAEGNTTPYVSIGNSTGWIVGGIHTYGEAPNNAIVMDNALNTILDGVYIERYIDNALNMGAIQGGLVIDNLTVRAEAAVANSNVIRLSRSSAVERPSVVVGQVNLIHPNDLAIFGIHTVSSLINVIMDPIAVSPNNAGTAGGAAFVTQVRPAVGQPDSNFRVRLAGRTYRHFLTDDADDRLTVGVTDAARGQLPTLSRDYFLSGSTPAFSRGHTFSLRGFRQVQFTVSISTRSFNNGAARATAEYTVIVDTKNNASDAWVIRSVERIAPSGFAVAPTFSISNASGSGAVEGTLTVAGEVSNTDARGSIAFTQVGGIRNTS
jgi:hypothetical protein